METQNHKNIVIEKESTQTTRDLDGKDMTIMSLTTFKSLPNIFSSQEELYDGVRKYVFEQGFAISVKRTKRDRAIFIGCDRGARRSNQSCVGQKRQAGSRMIDCPFDVRGHRKSNGSWKLTVANASHNHKPSVDMSGHPSCRRLSEIEASRVKDMTRAGITPRQILSSLRENNPDLQAVAKTVYNAKAKICREYLAGRSMIQALINELGEGGFKYNINHDNDGHVTHLFFAHPASNALSRSFSTVFVMDCTYKTNRYMMTLLDIVGVSCFNTSFYSCFAFLRKEEVEDYVWALRMFREVLGKDCSPSVIVTDRELALMNAIKIIFPDTVNLLCVWHIEKNILTKCKSHFEEGRACESFLCYWSKLINSTTRVEFDENLRSFEVAYNDRQVVLDYLRGTWLPFKKLFVVAWTNMYMHLGNHVTSRAEGAHSTLKKYLQVSTGDLVEVKKKICLAIENQLHEIKTRLSSEKVRVSHYLRIPIFKELVTCVSVFALKKLYEQYKIAQSSEGSLDCKKHFMSYMGLPCAHKLRLMTNEAIQLHMIHSQWRLDTVSLLDKDISQHVKEDKFDDLILELRKKYREWSLDRKELVERQIRLIMEGDEFQLLER